DCFSEVGVPVEGLCGAARAELLQPRSHATVEVDRSLAGALGLLTELFKRRGVVALGERLGRGAGILLAEGEALRHLGHTLGSLHRFAGLRLEPVCDASSGLLGSG